MNKFFLFPCRNSHPPAAEYVNHINRSNVNLVEAFRNMHVDEEEPHQNGGLDHDVRVRAYIQFLTQNNEILENAFKYLKNYLPKYAF